MLFRFIILLLVVFTTATVNSSGDSGRDLFKLLKSQPPPTNVGQLGVMKILSLRPTQNRAGLIEIEKKQRRLGAKKKKQIADYLIKHPVPVVIGPDGYYMVDHHHLARSVLGLERNKIAVTVIADLSKLSVEEFWQEMIDQKWAFNEDESGRTIPASEMESRMPKTVLEMIDDPYRSLAGEVKRLGGFIKTKPAYFIEFEWARFFRNIPALRNLSDNFSAGVDEAISLIKRGEADHLPGVNHSTCVGVVVRKYEI